MEGNESELSSFFDQSNTVTVTVTASPTKGLFPSSDVSLSQSQSQSQTESHVPYPHSQLQAQTPKKKRGRPRKYESPAQALAAKKASSTSSFPSSNKSHSSLLGSSGHGFTSHVITVAAGEDVSQKIMSFMQQRRRAMCILSASGSISNASLRQPATSGGNITYEGCFEIVSLSGSYVLNERGIRTGGLSVCLSNTDGQFIGGGIVGPLKAAGPVQVIVGTFFIDPKKDTRTGIREDVSSNKLPPPVGEPASSLGFQAAVDVSSGNPVRGNEEHQAIGGSHFMLQQCGLQMTPSHSSDWGDRSDSINAGFELTGRIGHGAHLSPENGDYEQIPD
ncbi:AT-hook motif nuclear-localized protein 14-like isoform X2 [Abrus precatorius]|uniref:AT-hook motif nuclear-localized protein n=1 Tax=Abrus precatorius TaxID=3816 RepID=A0A8B8MC14_ABRPR|nr:AT-hook motif nuclear-localized protein 14-like isoform X2 [Abrus precatorius]